jgi:hypothetical protein
MSLCASATNEPPLKGVLSLGLISQVAKATTLPLELITGPPLLPPEKAASNCKNLN